MSYLILNPNMDLYTRDIQRRKSGIDLKVKLIKLVLFLFGSLTKLEFDTKRVEHSSWVRNRYSYFYMDMSFTYWRKNKDLKRNRVLLLAKRNSSLGGGDNLTGNI